MTTKTWTGSLSTDWTVAGNWDTGVPGSTDDVVIGTTMNSPALSTGFPPTLPTTPFTVNSITITGTDTLTLIGTPTLAVATAMSIGSGSVILGGPGGSASAGGQTQIGGGSMVFFPVATLAASSITLDTGFLGGNGNVVGAVTVTGKGTIDAGGQLEVTGPITDTGNSLTLEINAGSTLLLDASATAQSVNFAGAGGTLALGNGLAPLSTATLTLGTQLAISTGAAVRLNVSGATLNDPSGVTLGGGFIGGMGTINPAISGTGTIGVNSNGTLHLTGTIASGPTLSTGDNSVLSIENTATAAAPIALAASQPSLVIGPSGTLTINGGVENIGKTASVSLTGGQLTDSAGFTIADGGRLSGFGKITGAISGGTGGGIVTALGGTLELASAIPSTPTAFDIGAASTLLLDETPGAGDTFIFLAPSGILALTDAAGFNGFIAHLNVGTGGAKTNFVHFLNEKVAITSVTGQGSVDGSITLSDGAVLNLNALSSSTWTVSAASDGASGTDIFVSDKPGPAGLTLSPASDSGAKSDSITNIVTPVITGTGEAGDTLTLRDGTTTIFITTVDSNGNWSATTTKLADGVHMLTATETDAGGTVSGPSAPFALTIDTIPATAPAGLTLSPASDSDPKGDSSTNLPTPVITGTGDAGATLTLLDGAASVGTTTVDKTGNWSITTAALAFGKHTLTATEVDAAGNASPASAPLVLTIESGGGGGTIVTGTSGADTLTGTGGADLIQGLDGNDTLIGLGGADTLDGGPGTDTADYSKDGANGGAFSVVADLSKTFLNKDGFGATDTLISIENLVGTDAAKLSSGAAFGDVLIGDTGPNVISGLGGPDYIDGGLGDDSLSGGDGNDAIVGGLGADNADGGAGDDVLLMGDFTNPTAADGNDIAHGGAGNDLLWGYGGNDTLFGGDGNDALVGNDFGSAVTGTDTMFGEAGDDTFFVGLGGNATMDGGAGNDKFFGGPGDDVMIGGPGNDFMFGAGGADTFVFHAADLVFGNADVVYFFSASDGDTLQFDASLKGGLTVTTRR